VSPQPAERRAELPGLSAGQRFYGELPEDAQREPRDPSLEHDDLAADDQDSSIDRILDWRCVTVGTGNRMLTRLHPDTTDTNDAVRTSTATWFLMASALRELQPARGRHGRRWSDNYDELELHRPS
jgi:hypothetical protein